MWNVPLVWGCWRIFAELDQFVTYSAATLLLEGIGFRALGLPEGKGGGENGVI